MFIPEPNSWLEIISCDPLAWQIFFQSDGIDTAVLY